MSESVDELTIRYEENDIEVIKELKKHILSKGAWTTIMFLYQEWDRAKEAYSEPKVSIRRYQKRNNQFSQKSKFNISSAKQGLEVAKMLQEWFPE
ncbi:hypothetical protein WDW89_02760 [Deltaproteobacteria bacterium TL4]